MIPFVVNVQQMHQARLDGGHGVASHGATLADWWRDGTLVPEEHGGRPAEETWERHRIQKSRGRGRENANIDAPEEEKEINKAQCAKKGFSKGHKWKRGG